MLTYKAEAVGIRVLLTEESYTSKASFLDRDPLPKWKSAQKSEQTFSGKRIKRGLYRAKDGTLINADINGAGNILRKVVPNAFGPKGDRGWCGTLPSSPSSTDCHSPYKPENNGPSSHSRQDSLAFRNYNRLIVL